MISPNKTHRSHGVIKSIKDNLSFVEIIIINKSGHELKALLYHKELPKNIKVGETYNFQARWSITCQSYMINKIGSKKAV